MITEILWFFRNLFFYSGYNGGNPSRQRPGEYICQSGFPHQTLILFGISKMKDGFGKIGIGAPIAGDQPDNSGKNSFKIDGIEPSHQPFLWKGKFKDHDLPARPHHTDHFGERLLFLHNISQTKSDHRTAEGVFPERKGQGISKAEPASPEKPLLQKFFPGPSDHRF